MSGGADVWTRVWNWLKTRTGDSGGSQVEKLASLLGAFGGDCGNSVARKEPRVGSPSMPALHENGESKINTNKINTITEATVAG